jgi:hypothetical protein
MFPIVALLLRAVGVQVQRPDAGHLGVLLEEPDQHAQASRPELDVGVEEQHEFAPSPFVGLVDGLRIAPVLRIRDQREVVTGGQRLGGSVL